MTMFVLYIWLAGSAATPFPGWMATTQSDCEALRAMRETVNADLPDAPYRFACKPLVVK